MTVAIITFARSYQLDSLRKLLTDLDENLDYPDTDIHFFIFAEQPEQIFPAENQTVLRWKVSDNNMLYLFHYLIDSRFKNFKFVYYFPVNGAINSKFNDQPTKESPILAVKDPKNLNQMFFGGVSSKIIDMSREISDTIDHNDKLNTEPDSILFYFLEYLKKNNNLFRLLPNVVQDQEQNYDEVLLDQDRFITTKLSTNFEKLVMQIYILSYAAKATNRKFILHTTWHKYLLNRIRGYKISQPYRISIHKNILKDNLSDEYAFTEISNSVDIRCTRQNFFVKNPTDNYYVPDSYLKDFKKLVSLSHYGLIKTKPYYGIYISIDNQLEIESFLDTLEDGIKVDLLYTGDITKNTILESQRYIEFDSMDRLFVNLCYYQKHYDEPKFSLNWWSEVLKKEIVTCNKPKKSPSKITNSNTTLMQIKNKRKNLLKRIKLNRVQQIKNLKKI